MILFEIMPVSKGGKYFHKWGYTARFAVEDGRYIYRFGGLDPLLVDDDRAEDFLASLQDYHVWAVEH